MGQNHHTPETVISSVKRGNGNRVFLKFLLDLKFYFYRRCSEMASYMHTLYLYSFFLQKTCKTRIFSNLPRMPIHTAQCNPRLDLCPASTGLFFHHLYCHLGSSPLGTWKCMSRPFAGRTFQNPWSQSQWWNNKCKYLMLTHDFTTLLTLSAIFNFLQQISSNWKKNQTGICSPR